MFHVEHSSLALYVHWPFCRSLCPYCDFNSHVAETIDHKAWAQHYVKELSHFAKELPGRRLVSIFFGGGTPSLMEPRTVEAILSAARKHFPFEPETEITLECNPTSAEAGKFAAFRAAGINRLSMGIQSLKDADLKFLGRQHSSQEALAAMQAARQVWENVSFDLIYARPGQTVKAWESELTEALSFGTPHLSLYQLTIEKGTPFYAAHQRGDFTIPESDEAAALYEATARLTAKAGLADYEVSNYARPGYESRHNLVYWQYGEYLGIGPGAHSRLKMPQGRRALMMRHQPQSWLRHVGTHGHGIQTDETIAGKDALIEALMMGLRLKQGIRRQALAPLLSTYGPALKERMVPLIEAGFLKEESEHIRATTKGRMVLGSVMEKLSDIH
jgi:oxygen-independent coproporphyrinogen-3 oxidase